MRHSEERYATKNLEILRAAQDDNYSLRGACPELVEGLRMTFGRFRMRTNYTQPLLTHRLAILRPQDNKVVITDITVYFREKEMQDQRHEVCLKYIRFGVMEYWSVGVLEQCSF